MTEVLPKADSVEADWYVTPSHQIWINNGLICATDRGYLADMLVRAINSWAQTEDGKTWWKDLQEKDRLKVA